jgi:hypothetical protein
MKTTYTVPEVAGSKRTSERPYTHAVVGQYNLTLAREGAQDKGWIKGDTKNWTWHKESAAMKPGDLIHVTGSARPWSYPMDEKAHGEHVAFMAANPDLDAYVAKLKAGRLARIDKEYGEGPLGPVVVLQWSMSLKNASTKIGEHSKYHGKVRVVECVPVEKKAKASKVAA